MYSLTPPSARCRTGARSRSAPQLVVLLPPAGFYPIPLGKDVGVQWEASGSGCRALTSAGQAGPGPRWHLLGWVLVSAPGCAAPGGTRVSGWAMPEWHHPALFLHLHGDVQEAVQMEICKTER